MHVSVASRFRDRARVFAIFVCIAFAVQATAAEPLVRNVNLRGLQIEGTTTIVIDGDHLAARLLLPFAAKSELKPDSTDKKATFDVTVPADATPGYCNLRVVTDGGVSLPILIGVDKLPQKPAAAAIEQLPSAALHGAVGGSAVVETKFTGKAGQPLTVEVEAQRLDSKLRPVLHLYNAKRRTLAWSWPTPTLQGDTRLETTLPADGEYTLALHDIEYGPPGPGHYRLKVGQFAYVDQVFPPVISKGQAAKVEIGPPTPLLIDVAAPSLPGSFPLPAGQAWSGPRPFIEIDSHAELIEQVPAPEGSQPLPADQVGVSGKLSTPLEEDRYRLTVTPNAKLPLRSLRRTLRLADRCGDCRAE